MVIVMEESATEDQVSAVIDKLVRIGFDIHRSTGVRHTVLGAVGGQIVDTRDIEVIDGVKAAMRELEGSLPPGGPEGVRWKRRGVSDGT